jgi:hypothetical protein
VSGFGKRLNALESAAGLAEDDSFCAQVARAHAQGETIPRIIVEPGETVEEVREREGIADGMPCIARIIVSLGDRDG